MPDSNELALLAPHSIKQYLDQAILQLHLGLNCSPSDSAMMTLNAAFSKHAQVGANSAPHKHPPVICMAILLLYYGKTRTF
jgi:hypothetical protein